MHLQFHKLFSKFSYDCKINVLLVGPLKCPKLPNWIWHDGFALHMSACGNRNAEVSSMNPRPQLVPTSLTITQLGKNNCDLETYSVCLNFIYPSKELCSKISLEVGVSLPWWCHALVLLAPGYWRLFFTSHNFFIMEKWPVSEEF